MKNNWPFLSLLLSLLLIWSRRKELDCIWFILGKRWSRPQSQKWEKMNFNTRKIFLKYWSRNIPIWVHTFLPIICLNRLLIGCSISMKKKCLFWLSSKETAKRSVCQQNCTLWVRFVCWCSIYIRKTWFSSSSLKIYSLQEVWMWGWEVWEGVIKWLNGLSRKKKGQFLR